MTTHHVNVIRFEVTFAEYGVDGVAPGEAKIWRSAARFNAPSDSPKDVLAAMALMCWHDYRRDAQSPAIWERDEQTGGLVCFRFGEDGARFYFGARPVPADESPERSAEIAAGEYGITHRRPFDPYAPDTLYMRETAQQRAREAAEAKARATPRKETCKRCGRGTVERVVVGSHTTRIVKACTEGCEQ